MKIKRSIYEQILGFCHVVPPEVGGIIGTHRDIIDSVVLDGHSQVTEAAVYIPDVGKLNDVLVKWQRENIAFCGMFHSHMQGQETLSSGDIEYIKMIFSALPKTVTKLFFPVVIPNTCMISYLAVNENNGVEILEDRLELIF